MLLTSINPENKKINQDFSLSHIRSVLEHSMKIYLPFFSVMFLTDTDFPEKK